ncbi:unnamed protein product [Amaranthus hypochondriacus]
MSNMGNEKFTKEGEAKRTLEKQVLHQRKNMPMCPIRLGIGGAVVAAAIGYLVLYSKKKPEASAMDVAKVTTGVANPDNTHPRI